MYTTEEILRRKKLREIHARQRIFKRNVLFSIVSILMISLVFSVVCGNTITDKQYVTVAVNQGDTLWSIAGEYTDGDIRSEIIKIKKVNNLKTSDLTTDMILKIPVD